MEKRNGFVVVCMNTTKVGYYILRTLAYKRVPKFCVNGSTLMDYKVYDYSKNAERAANVVSRYYVENPNIITKVMPQRDLQDNLDYESMKHYFETH